MPIYEYQCEECGHKLEVMQRMSEDPLKTCPSCAEDTLKKLVSKAGFRLTGTGWYETDFKDKGKPEDDKGEKKEKEKEKEGSGDKKDAKESKKDEAKKDTSSDTKKSDSTESSKASTSTTDD